ncbi:helix-turn-helix domain-containing protein [uncultured Halomonas sp.]|uniref:helix-turn-helix domain-containing protein n=1 Tax=uncultured Halomonas sp. TaxID=173971 RepID=UPI00260D2FB7|nr:helix-turn-helix domain-containing protein [uncultured Halomonas sp.]
MLLAYAWPGNVRELEHVISRAAIKALSHGARRDEIITLGPAWLDLPIPEGRGDSVPQGSGSPASIAAPSLREQVEMIQRRAIREALDACEGRWAAAARRLELDPSNLHKLARRLGIK